MHAITTEPIDQKWTTEANVLRLAYAITDHLAYYSVADIPADLRPLLAAAADELSVELGLPSQPRPDTPVVVALRIIAKAALLRPAAGGEHSYRLLTELTARHPPMK